MRELCGDDFVILLWTCVLVFSGHDQEEVSMWQSPFLELYNIGLMSPPPFCIMDIKRSISFPWLSSLMNGFAAESSSFLVGHNGTWIPVNKGSMSSMPLFITDVSSCVDNKEGFTIAFESLLGVLRFRSWLATTCCILAFFFSVFKFAYFCLFSAHMLFLCCWSISAYFFTFFS